LVCSIISSEDFAVLEDYEDPITVNIKASHPLVLVRFISIL